MAGFRFEKDNEDINLIGGDDEQTAPQRPTTRPSAATARAPQSRPNPEPQQPAARSTNIPQRPTQAPKQPDVRPSAGLPSRPNAPAAPQRQPVEQGNGMPNRAETTQRTQRPPQQPVQTRPEPIQERPVPRFQEERVNVLPEVDDDILGATYPEEKEPEYVAPVRRVQRPVVEEEYEEEEEEAPRRVPRKKPATKSTAKSKKRTTDDEAKKSRWAGGRRAVLISRIVILTVFAVICLVGLKGIFFPTQFPSQQQVISVVKDGIGVTNFPTDKGQGFATAFLKTYLTFTDDFDRDEALKQYASTQVIEQMPLRVGPIDDTIVPEEGASGEEEVITPQSEQRVVGEPTLIGVESVDDENAVFTLQATLTTGSTITISVPVFFDEKTNGMAVSAPASILPGIGLAAVPTDNHAITWPNDPDVVADFEPDLASYLTAWAASDADLINRYVLQNASLDAKAGLNGSVVFKQIEELKVQLVNDGEGDTAKRQALVSVIWADPRSENITYTQYYLLAIQQTPDNKWNIGDITSVVVKDSK